MDGITVKVRRMTEADIDFGMELKNTAGWNQVPADWDRLIALEPEGCFVATINGQSVGTATTTSYEDKFGWVAMVLVHPDHRRKGIGTTLLDACIDYLQDRVATIKLDATPMGKKLYDTLGFVDEYMMERWMGRGLAPTEIKGVTPVTEAEIDALCEFDLPVFGADRSRLLQRFLSERTTVSACMMDGRQMLGYGIARPGYNSWQIGPVVAGNQSVAEKLLRALLGSFPSEPVFADLLMPNPHILDLVRSLGLEKQRYLIRMYKGPNLHPGHPEYVYAAAGPEKG